jgi:hypothetical protein
MIELELEGEMLDSFHVTFPVCEDRNGTLATVQDMINSNFNHIPVPHKLGNYVYYVILARLDD